MQTRTLGFTDIHCSEIALGTWGLASGVYGRVEPSRFEGVVREAWEHGITTFDVASLWGETESEWRTAAALGDHLKHAVLISRAGRVREGKDLTSRFDSQSIIEQVEASLRRLGRGHIDVLLLHHPPLKVLGSDLFRKGLDHLIATGKIRAWGASISSIEEGRLAMKVGAQAICLTHHLLEPETFHELASDLEHHGCSAIVRSPLCHGLLSGQWSKDTVFPAPDDHRNRRWDRDALITRLEHVEDLRFLVKNDVPDLATAALRFAISNPFVLTACVGARNVAQVAHAAQASRQPPYLPPEDLQRLLGKKAEAKIDKVSESQ
jgi:aryl-alcohol dehydrogenase-like predicted oxidoreductase